MTLASALEAFREALYFQVRRKFGDLFRRGRKSTDRVPLVSRGV